MASDRGTAAEEGHVRARIEGLAEAVRAKDVEAVMSAYAPDAVTFDLAPPLQYAGADALRRSFTDWFVSFDGPVGLELRDLTVTAGQDTAFCHSLNRITGRRTDGEQTDVWVRATFGLRKIDGAWLVTHEHTSTPFYMDGSFKAAVDLKPQL